MIIIVLELYLVAKLILDDGVKINIIEINIWWENIICYYDEYKW